MAHKENIDDFKLKALIKASDNGEEWAQREYGRIFDEYDMDPNFIDRVCRARINIYKEPAERGDKNAILRYAHALAHLGYTKEAYNWYLSLINKGDTDAMLALSQQYNEYGSFGHKPDEEMRWLKLAADGGNAEAQNKMGLECFCASDRYNALLWYELSASQNNTEGKIGYAECLQEQLSVLDEYSRGWDEAYPERYKYIKNTYGQLSPQECQSLKKDLFDEIEKLYLYGIDHSNQETYLSTAYNGLARLYLYPQGVCSPMPYLSAYYNFEYYLVLGNDFAYKSCMKTIKERNLKVTKSDLQEWDEIGIYEWSKKHGIEIFAKKVSGTNTPTVDNVPHKNTETTIESVVKEPKKEPIVQNESQASIKEIPIKLADGTKTTVKLKTSSEEKEERTKKSPLSGKYTINNRDFENFKKLQNMIASYSSVLNACVDFNGYVSVACKPKRSLSYCSFDKNVIAVEVGEKHVVALKSDGKVKAKFDGWLYSQQCEVNDWRDIIAIRANNSTTLGLRKDGTVCLAGAFPLANRVREWSSIVDIAIGRADSGYVIGLKSDGTVISECIGNKSGAASVRHWKDIISISARLDHTVGLRSDGTLIATGSNSLGKCKVHGLENIVSVSAGDFNTVCLRADGTVVIVGDKSCGQEMAESWQNIVAVKSSHNCILGVAADGTIKVAGKIKYNESNGVSKVKDWNLFHGLSKEEKPDFIQSVIRGRTNFLKQFE